MAQIKRTLQNLTAGTRYVVRVRGVNQFGVSTEWSEAISFNTGTDVGPPGAPTGLITSAGVRTIILQWSPNTENDFDHYDIHVSTVNGFTPTYPPVPGGYSASSTLYGQVPPTSIISINKYNNGTSWVDLVPGSTYYIRLIAVDNSGNKSAASSQITAQPGVVKNTDIATDSITADKLTTSELFAAITVSGTIKTASGGARVEMGVLADSTLGLAAYANDGITKNLHYKHSDGSLSIRGTLQSTNYVFTTLTSGVTLPTGTVGVVSTADYPSSGSFYISSQKVDYTGKTGTTFTGCTGGTGTFSSGTVVSLGVGWRTTAAGDAEYNSVVIRGKLATATIEGDLIMSGGSIKTASSGARIELTGAGGIKRYTSGGDVDFELVPGSSKIKVPGTSSASTSDGFQLTGAGMNYVFVASDGTTTFFVYRATSTDTYLSFGEPVFILENSIVHKFGATYPFYITNATEIEGICRAKGGLEGNADGGFGAELRERNGHLTSFGWNSSPDSYDVWIDGSHIAQFDVSARTPGTPGTPALKTFIIDHPVKNDRYLVHSCLEGPEAGVFYRGRGTIHNGSAIVELPDYVAALVDEPSATITLTPIKHLATMAVTEDLRDGHFSVVSSDTEHDFHWVVLADRKDAPIVVEPKKSDVDVFGDGPYKYYQPKG